MKKLIYALVSAGDDPAKLQEMTAGMRGLADEPLSLISTGAIHAVCGDTGAKGPEVSRDNALAFAAVTDAFWKDFTLLPVRFGSVMDSAETVLSMLVEKKDAILSGFSGVEGRCEFGIKVFFNQETQQGEEAREAEPVPEKPAGTPAGQGRSVFSEYVAGKLRAHREEEKLLAYVTSVAGEIEGCLARLKATGKTRKMTNAATMADVVLLLEQEKSGLLVAEVSDLQKRHPGLSFLLTGPWPPYSFSDLTLKPATNE